MIAAAEASASSGRWASRSTRRLRHVDGDLESAAGHRQLHAARDRRLSAARAQQRAGRQRYGAMPNIFSGYQTVDDPEVRAQVRSGLGRDAADRRRASTITRWSRRSTRASSSAMYLFGEEMSTSSTPTRTMCGEAFAQARLLRGAGHLLQRDLPLMPTSFCRRAEPGKGGDLHQHRAAHPAALSGVRAAGRESKPDWQILQTDREPPRSQLELQASVRDHGRDRAADADCSRA